MSRALAAAGWSYVALCGLILASHREIPRDIPRGGEPPHPAAPYGGDAGSWFAQIKPFCNAVEVEVQQQRTPAPSDASGAGYSAACYALAGKIDRARAVIDSLPTRLRPQAAHPQTRVIHRSRFAAPGYCSAGNRCHRRCRR